MPCPLRGKKCPLGLPGLGLHLQKPGCASLQTPGLCWAAFGLGDAHSCLVSQPGKGKHGKYFRDQPMLR